jgi:hypothetical protein
MPENKHPESIDATEYPNVIRVMYTDRSYIWYLSHGNGMLTPGYLYTVMSGEHVVDMFISFEMHSHPEVLRIRHA